MSSDVYTLVYKKSVAYRTAASETRIRVVKGETILANQFGFMPLELRKHFIKGRVTQIDIAKLTQKGVVAGRLPREANRIVDVDYQTGEKVAETTDKPPTDELVLPNFKKINAQDVVAWAMEQAWLPIGTVDPDAMKKDNVAAIEAAFKAHTIPDEPPVETGSKAPAGEGMAGKFERTED